MNLPGTDRPLRLWPTVVLAALLGTTGLALVVPITANAQTLPQGNSDAELLLSADELVYDNDAQIITARGAVQMEYDGYNVVAQRVSYNRQTRRVQAFGDVEIIEPDGNRIYADEIDLTDDFSDGFVNTLRVETTDNTRFAAESAERRAGQRTVFNNGVYTACEVCAENPAKPPIWQIKAEKVVLDGVEKTVTYRNATFEMFGRPIAYFPYFQHADPSIKRKSGFLFPTGGFSDELGYFFRQSYFLPTSQSTDLTIAGAYYTEQGLLGDLRWRHQMENGFYSIRAAGIRQQDEDEFDFSPDNDVEDRGMIATEGRFDINPRWAFGWSWLEQSDSNFARTYAISDWDEQEITNKLHLTGLANRSFFELSAQQYLVQPSISINPASDNYDFYYEEDQQAYVRPLLDYNYETTDGLLGGLVSLDVNLQGVRRDAENVFTLDGRRQVLGVEGASERATAELGWKRTLTSRGGLLLTPELSVRGDWLNVDEKTAGFDDVLLDGNGTRLVATAGVTASYPLLITGPTSTHILEPIAQVYARPEVNNDKFFVNEDARSLVFDTTNLLQDSKFSGYDRVEEGVRANLAMRYAGFFSNGLSLNAKIGQSYHLAGENAYARMDGITNTGAQSGLEDDVSDIVSSVSLSTAFGLGVNNENRFDNEDMALRRTTLGTTYENEAITASLAYTFIASQPAVGYDDDREQIGGVASYRFADNWSFSAGAQFDVNDERLLSDQYGFAYGDECYTFSLNFTRSHAEDGSAARAISFRFGFRTVGDFAYSVGDAQIDGFESNGFLSANK